MIRGLPGRAGGDAGRTDGWRPVMTDESASQSPDLLTSTFGPASVPVSESSTLSLQLPHLPVTEVMTTLEMRPRPGCAAVARAASIAGTAPTSQIGGAAVAKRRARATCSETADR